MVTFYFFFNDTATTEIYTLSLHDALPISEFLQGSGILSLGYWHGRHGRFRYPRRLRRARGDQWWSGRSSSGRGQNRGRSEEHTSELQSRQYLVCRLLLEKKKRQCTQFIIR